MSQDPRPSDDPLLRALHAMPREDLSAATLASQRDRLHAELARAHAFGVRPPAVWVDRLEATLLWICGGCVLARLGMSIALIVRAAIG